MKNDPIFLRTWGLFNCYTIKNSYTKQVLLFSHNQFKWLYNVQENFRICENIAFNWYTRTHLLSYYLYFSLLPQVTLGVL